jgi:energy-coupling factor transporter ATP-binding protein EcfA2
MDLWISGFRSLNNASVRFPDGVSALTGDSGTGKTTLITALHWILYGSAGSGPHKATKIQSAAGAAAGAVAFHTSAGIYTFARAAPGKRAAQPPEWLLPAARFAILSHDSHSVLECMWINEVPGNFAADRLALCGSQTTFSSTAIVSQKLPSQLLACGKLSQTVQDFFFTDEGEDSPGTYIPQLQAIQRSLKEDLGRLSVRRDGVTLDLARANARTDTAARPLQRVGPELVPSFSGHPLDPRAASSAIKSRVRQLAIDLHIPCSDPHTLSQTFRSVAEAQKRSHGEWRDRARAAIASRAVREALPDPAALRENINILTAELRGLLGELVEPSRASRDTVADGPQTWIHEAQAKDTLRAAQAALAASVVQAGPAVFETLETATAALEAGNRAMAMREAYARKAAALHVDPDAVSLALINEEIENLHDEEVCGRQALISSWTDGLRGHVWTFNDATGGERADRDAAILIAKERNQTAAEIRRSIDARAAAVGTSVSEVHCRLHSARLIALEQEEAQGRAGLHVDWWIGMSREYGELNHAQEAWLADVRHARRTAEAHNLNSLAHQAAFESRAADLGVGRESLLDAIASEALSLLEVEETGARSRTINAFWEELNEQLEAHNAAIAKMSADRRELAEGAEIRNTAARALIEQYDAEARRLGTCTTMLAADIAHIELIDLESQETFGRLCVAADWRNAVRDARSSLMYDADAEIRALTNVRHAAELRNAASAATHKMAVAQYEASVEAYERSVERRSAADARISILSGALRALTDEKGAAVRAREAILTRCVGVPAQCPACASQIYISDGKLVAEAVTVEYAKQQHAEALRLEEKIGTLQAKISSVSEDLRNQNIVSAGCNFELPVRPVSPIYEPVLTVPMSTWHSLRGVLDGDEDCWPGQYAQDPRLPALRTLASRALPIIEPVPITWKTQEICLDPALCSGDPLMVPNTARILALRVLASMPYPDLIQVPLIPTAMPAPAPIPAPPAAARVDWLRIVAEMESIAAAEYPENVLIPPPITEAEAPPEMLISRQRRHTYRLGKLRLLAAEPRPNAEDTQIAAARASIEYHRHLETHMAHVASFGDLSELPAFQEPEARRLAGELAVLEGRMRAEAEAAERAETVARGLEAAVGPEPRVDSDLADLPEAILNAHQFDLALADSLRAYGEAEAVEAEGAELGRRLSVTMEALERVVRVRAEYVERALETITDGVNHMLQFLFEGHARYVLRADDKDRIESVLEHAGREDVDLMALSGGELDRFSIAVTAAFARVLGSPVLIFDETLASLDPARRTDCVEAVAKLLPGRPVIFVTHDPPQGLFETILNTADLRGGQ